MQSAPGARFERNELSHVPTPTRLLLVDDQPFVLAAWESRLARCPEVQVIGAATSGPDALLAAARLRPDIVLLDLRMPGMDGVATLASLREHCPEIPVIMWTVSDQEGDLADCILAGAAGYLLKDCSLELLRKTIRSAGEGSICVPRELIQRIVARSARASWERAPAADSLSTREREVLQLIVNGYSTQGIAEELSITTATIKKHIHNILVKLGVSDRTQATITALRLGIATLR